MSNDSSRPTAEVSFYEADPRGHSLTHRGASSPVDDLGVNHPPISPEPIEVVQTFLEALLESGLVRASAEAGTGQGKGTKGRSGTDNTLKVYLVLLVHTPDSPTITEIMRVTGIGSKNTVKNSLANLEALGAIKWHKRRHGHEYEVLDFPSLGLPEPSISARRPGSTKKRHRDEPTTFRAPDGHVLPGGHQARPAVRGG